MVDDEEQKVLRAKAFAWRAIGCAVWLAIAIVILMGVMLLFPLWGRGIF